MEVEANSTDTDIIQDSAKQPPKPLEVRRALEDYLEQKRRQREEEYLFEE